MLVFVTVGSTRFDALIEACFTQDVLSALLDKGYTHLVIQCGNSSFKFDSMLDQNATVKVVRHGVDIEYFRFLSSLEESFNKASLVIGHAGSGTILEVLRQKEPKPLIVVPNDTLLDNHQEDLAKTLDELGYLKRSSVHELATTIRQLDTSQIKPFPPADPTRFAKIVDECVGFV